MLNDNIFFMFNIFASYFPLIISGSILLAASGANKLTNATQQLITTKPTIIAVSHFQLILPKKPPIQIVMIPIADAGYIIFLKPLKIVFPDSFNASNGAASAISGRHTINATSITNNITFILVNGTSVTIKTVDDYDNTNEYSFVYDSEAGTLVDAVQEITISK